MEVVGSAASVIGVIDLSVRITSICLQYSRDARHAKADIKRFKLEVDSVTILLRAVEALLK